VYITVKDAVNGVVLEHVDHVFKIDETGRKQEKIEEIHE
jgi:hypothetical protein